jgi:hypothetical protein
MNRSSLSLNNGIWRAREALLENGESSVDSLKESEHRSACMAGAYEEHPEEAMRHIYELRRCGK